MSDNKNVVVDISKRRKNNRKRDNKEEVLPKDILVNLRPIDKGFDTFEYWIEDENILCTKVGKVVVIKCLTAILADIADDDPELQVLALESLEDIMRLYVLGGCGEEDDYQ